jgi:predicted neuraminidase
MICRIFGITFLSFLCALGPCARGQTLDAGVVKMEFIADQPRTPSSHASTIIESQDVLIAAWFGGTHERALDVSIWLSRNEGNGWSEPEEVANGYHEKDHIRYPCWNPVLFRGKDGPLYLFYKEGPSPSSWWGMVKTSEDNGRSWSREHKLPRDIVGPVRNKPVQLADGTILCGASTEDDGWLVHMERTKNPLGTWTKTKVLNESMDVPAIQPTILEHGSELQILCRTKRGYIAESWSADRGLTWGRITRTALPNPNSAIDAVTMRDGKSLLVYNHTESGRSPINVAVSPDGRRWFAGAVLESQSGSEFSYPAVIQSSDKLIHITYTWNRQRIRHVVVDPSKLKLKEIVEGNWPQ